MNNFSSFLCLLKSIDNCALFVFYYFKFSVGRFGSRGGGGGGAGGYDDRYGSGSRRDDYNRGRKDDNFDRR